MNAPHRPVGRRAQLTVFLTILLDLIGFGMILPLLPFYAQRFHATPVQIGLLFTSYSLTQLFFAPLLGRLSDRVGREWIGQTRRKSSVNGKSALEPAFRISKLPAVCPMPWKRARRRRRKIAETAPPISARRIR